MQVLYSSVQGSSQGKKIDPRGGGPAPTRPDLETPVGHA